jgi:excisionase family DNA binding protein
LSDLAERVLTVPEAARLMRVGVRSYYAAAARGEVPVVQIGRRLVVPGAMLARFLAGEEVVTPVGDSTGRHQAPAGDREEGLIISKENDTWSLHPIPRPPRAVHRRRKFR